MFFPYVFAWFLLRSGYGVIARAIAFGWLAIVLAVMVAGSRGGPGIGSGAAPPAPSAPTDPDRQAKDLAAATARIMVPKTMKDPGSAQFGQVWGMAPNVACGFVNGKNSFGALTGQQRFIFVGGQTEFEEQSAAFAKHWNTICVAKLTAPAPTGVPGKAWGSKPTADLRILLPKTDQGVSLYVPKGAPAALEGVPVNEADYGYDHDRFYSADFYLDGDDKGDAIKTALIRKFGTPLEYDDAIRSYKWAWPDRKVVVQIRYQPSTKRTTVGYRHGGH